MRLEARCHLKLGDKEFTIEGSHIDTRSDLYERKNMRDSYGAGFRIVTASGVVLRADLAHGKEGISSAIFIGYPWEL